jgi:4-hydroxybenzoate polyprenyltransferase
VTGVAARARVGPYLRLAKLDVPDYYLGIAVVWSLLGAAERTDPATLALLLVFVLGEVGVLAAMVALDDLTGYLDGSDRTNYGPDAPARRLARKPLVAGALTPAAAGRFAAATAAAGAALWAAAVLMAPRPAGWAVALTAVTFVVALQYSWGARLSYHGGQELFIAGLGWALLLAPYGLAGGGVDGFVVVQALLFGLGPLLFGVYSNTNDVAGDRAVNRPTVAATTSARGNTLFVGALSLAEAALVAGVVAAGAAPWWFLPVMTPAVALRAVQYDLGFRRGDILRARKLGMWVHRLTVVLLVVVNLAGAGGAGVGAR